MSLSLIGGISQRPVLTALPNTFTAIQTFSAGLAGTTAALSGGITCASQIIGTDPGGSEILRVGGAGRFSAGVTCASLTASQTITAGLGLVTKDGTVTRPAENHIALSLSSGVGYLDLWDQGASTLTLPLSVRSGLVTFSAGITCASSTITGTAPGTAPAGQVLIGGGVINAAGKISTAVGVEILKAGSDSIGAGPYMSFGDSAGKSIWQQGASALTLFQWDGSNWYTGMTIANATRQATFTGKITANSAAAASTMTGMTVAQLITYLQTILA